MSRDATAVLAGDVRAAARLMRDLEDRVQGAEEVLAEIYPHTGRAGIVGITGPPGCGKSTLVDALVAQLRRHQRRVGVVAIDPSSPLTGGAVLGDRIRMQRHALDGGVFVHSVASRGHLGGLSRSTGGVITVMEAMGADVVIVETVGVGQAEAEIAAAAHVCVVVVAPGFGDAVQTIKAGVLEIGDVLCVNKADHCGSERTVDDLRAMLALRRDDARGPALLRTVAVAGEGIPELLAEIDRSLGRHDPVVWGRRRSRRARRQIVELLQQRGLDVLLDRVGERMDPLVEAVAARRRDPDSVVDELLERALAEDPGRR